MTLNRRRFLYTATAGAALGSAVPARLLGSEGALTDSPPAIDSLAAHVKMRCDLAGGRSYWFYTGTVFGNRPGEATRPMLAVEGVSYSELETLPGGRYRYSLTEAGYYLDPESLTLEDRVLNPFTGKQYRPKHYLSSQVNIFSPDLSVKPDSDRLPPGLEYRGEITPLRVFGDRVWSAEDLFVRLPLKGGQGEPEFRVQTSLATLSADRRDLLDPEQTFMDCQLNYQTLGTWYDWMGMGDAPGMISWRMVGTKCRAADLPGYLAERIAGDHEGFFDA